MKNNRSRIAQIINIILICLISYINFSSDTESLFVAIVSSVVLTVLFSSGSCFESIVDLLTGIVSSVLIFCFKLSVYDFDYILNAAISVIDLYMPAFILQLCIRNKNNNLAKTVYFTAGSHILITCASLAKIKYIDKIDLLNEINLMYDDFLNMYTVLMTSATDAEVLQNTSEILNVVKETTIMLIPSFVIIVCVILSYLQIVAARALIKMYLKNEHNEIEHFYQIRTGRLLSTMTLVLLFIAFMSNDMYITSVVYNFAVTAGFIYFVSGLSVVYFFLIKKIRNIAVSLIILAVIVIISLFASALMPVVNIFTILFIVGLMDSSANFRKLKKVGD